MSFSSTVRMKFSRARGEAAQRSGAASRAAAALLRKLAALLVDDLEPALEDVGLEPRQAEPDHGEEGERGEDEGHESLRIHLVTSALRRRTEAAAAADRTGRGRAPAGRARRCWRPAPRPALRCPRWGRARPPRRRRRGPPPAPRPSRIARRGLRELAVGAGIERRRRCRRGDRARRFGLEASVTSEATRTACHPSRTGSHRPRRAR